MADGDDGGDGGSNDQLIAALRNHGDGALPQDMTEQIYTLLRQMGLITAPQHRAQAVGGMQEWLQQSRGSMANIMPQLLPQIRQLREQMATAFSTVSKRLGPAGGKQIARGQSEAVGASGAELSKMLTGMQQKGVSGLANFMQNLRPAGVTQMPQLTSSSEETPFNMAGLGQLLAQMAGTAGQIWPQSQAPTISSLNPGYQPIPSMNLSGMGSGYGDFITYGM